MIARGCDLPIPSMNRTALLFATVGQTVTATLPFSGSGRFHRLKVWLQ